MPPQRASEGGASRLPSHPHAQVEPVDHARCRELFEPFGSRVTERMTCVTGECRGIGVPEGNGCGRVGGWASSPKRTRTAHTCAPPCTAPQAARARATVGGRSCSCRAANQRAAAASAHRRGAVSTSAHKACLAPRACRKRRTPCWCVGCTCLVAVGASAPTQRNHGLGALHHLSNQSTACLS